MKKLVSDEYIKKISNENNIYEKNKLFCIYKEEIEYFCNYLYISNLYIRQTYNRKELLSIAYPAFIDSLKKYDNTKGKFETYLKQYIKYYILQDFKYTRFIRIPENFYLKKNREKHNGLIRQKFFSLDIPNIKEGGLSKKESIIFDYIDIDNHIINNDIITIFYKFIDRLKFIKYDKKVNIFFDYIINEKTYTAIGNKYNLTKERVRQIIVEMTELWKVYYETGKIIKLNYTTIYNEKKKELIMENNNQKNYDNRNALKKYCNKKITIIGKYIDCKESVTHRTKKQITRYLFRDISVKGDKIKLDHIWIPENGHIKKLIIYNELKENCFYEIKGIVQKYAKTEYLKDTPNLSYIKISYKIENIYSMKKINL